MSDIESLNDLYYGYNEIDPETHMGNPEHRRYQCQLCPSIYFSEADMKIHLEQWHHVVIEMKK